MRNLLYFLLGFTVVGAIVFAANCSFASYPGECTATFQTSPLAKTVDYDLKTIDSYSVSSTGSITPIASLKKRAVTYYAYDYAQAYFENGIWKVASQVNLAQHSSAKLADIQVSSITPLAMLSAAPSCPQACDPPNHINPLGECVNCPSGVFLVTGYCVPNCDYSHPYIPGELYNPPEGTGTCVMPECGEGQKEDAEGRCVPDCGENQKIDTVTGTCVYDCPYGTHEVNGECINDCLPGFYKDAETGSCVEERGCLPDEDFVNGLCVRKCLPGETRGPDGSCAAAPVNCPFGQHEENGKCVASKVNCPPGTSFDSALNTCKEDAVQQTSTAEVVHNGDGTYTETRTNITTISSGEIADGVSTGGTVSGTVVTIITGTIPAAGTSGPGSTEGTTETAMEFSPPDVQQYERPPRSINWDSWNSQKRRFAEEGPLKILRKLQGLFESLDVQPVTPSFDFVVGGHTFNVNLHAFDELAEATRFLMGCFMTIGAVTFGYRIFGLF